MINITKRAWRHILHHHTDAQFSRQRKKSKFYAKEDLLELIAQADQYAPHSLLNGNLERVFDAAHPIGIERKSGKPTSVVTVVTQPNNDLVTMFPGHRSRREHGS